jgi:hypothetical protein
VAQIFTMGIPVSLPTIMVRVDNVGTISMSENVGTSSRTKHGSLLWTNSSRLFLSVLQIISLMDSRRRDIYDKHFKKFIGGCKGYFASSE